LTIVSPDLVEKHVAKDELLEQAYYMLEGDEEVQSLLRMANVMAVGRLRYNDHGVVHSRIVAGSALEMFDILSRYVTPSIVKDRVGTRREAKLVVLLGAYLHDIGNAIHRQDHHIHGYYIADQILRRLLPRIFGYEGRRVHMIRMEVLHCIYSHHEEVHCLSLEAGIVKVADGTDMAKGRARVPYELGKVDIHSLSALAIDKVEIERGTSKPVRIVVGMSNEAGVFQVEEILGRKIKTSGIGRYIEVFAIGKDGRLRVTYSFQ